MPSTSARSRRAQQVKFGLRVDRGKVAAVRLGPARPVDLAEVAQACIGLRNGEQRVGIEVDDGTCVTGGRTEQVEAANPVGVYELLDHAAAS